MKTDFVQALTRDFEAHAERTDGGVEFWLARDLQHLLGYAEWRNFSSTVISKAKTACEVSGHAIEDHFVDVNKMVDLGSGSQRDVEDMMLTRYACYLIAQNLHLRLAHVHGGKANAIRLGRCRQVHPHPRVGQGRSLATAGHHRACGLVALNLDPAAPVHLGACTVLMPTQARKHGFLSVHARWGQRHGNQQAQR